MTDKPAPGSARSSPRLYGSQAERAYGTLAGKFRALERDVEAARASTRVSLGGCVLTFRPSESPARADGDDVRLADGAHIRIRPIEPDDAPALELALERLGALSRYEHFLTQARLDPRRLTAETRADHITREALVAFDAISGAGVGLARYLCDPDDHTRAEIACAVTDRWQGRGVGSALARQLAARARDNGIERLTARMFVGNDRARRLLAHVADVVGETRDGGLVEITATLAPPDR